MKLQFLLAGIVATGLFASAPDTVAHGGLGEGAAEAVTAAAARFMAAEAFMAGVVSGAFAAGISEAFAAGVSGAFAAGVSGAFAAGVSGTSTAGVWGAFTAIAVFSAMIVFSFPVSVSMGTRGGGIGVIRTTLTTRTITQITPAHTTVTMRITAIDS